MSKTGKTQNMRCLCAFAFIGACIASLLIVNALAHQTTGASKDSEVEEDQVQDSPLFDSNSTSMLEDPESALDDPEGLVFGMFSSVANTTQCAYEEAPEGFEEEVASCSECGTDAFLVAEGMVGFECSGNAEEVYSRIDEVLVQRGWNRVESEADQGGFTYIKDEGRYRWLFFSCSEVSGSVSAWMAYQTTEQED